MNMESQLRQDSTLIVRITQNPRNAVLIGLNLQSNAYKSDDRTPAKVRSINSSKSQFLPIPSKSSTDLGIGGWLARHHTGDFSFHVVLQEQVGARYKADSSDMYTFHNSSQTN